MYTKLKIELSATEPKGCTVSDMRQGDWAIITDKSSNFNGALILMGHGEESFMIVSDQSGDYVEKHSIGAWRNVKIRPCQNVTITHD